MQELRLDWVGRGIEGMHSLGRLRWKMSCMQLGIIQIDSSSTQNAINQIYF